MNKILLVGAGPMAVAYANVLKALNVDMVVVGRGEDSAKRFEEATDITVCCGGIENWLLHNKNVPAQAIVAVGEKWLGKVSLMLIDHGVKSLLVEKPGGATSNEVEIVSQRAKEHDAKVFVAYNRRFYASVNKAREIIFEDGGVSSFNFEFTEWSHVIRDLQKEEGVKEQWFLHNSTHVIDLAFYLGGKPIEMSCYTAGGLDWHPSASVYAGAGKSEKGALFSYQANWEAPGRWGVEVLTKRNRLIFRPLESLQVQKIGSVQTELVSIDDNFDKIYKAGLYKQTESFIYHRNETICTIEEQCEKIKIYEKMRKTNNFAMKA